MTGKEKFIKAVNHEEAPVLFDIGSCSTTGIHCKVLSELRALLGLPQKPETIIEPMQMLGYVDEDIRQALGIETQHLWGKRSMFGFSMDDDYKEWRTPWGQTVLVPKGFVTTENSRGDTLIYAEGDTNYAPAGCMPNGGWFFEGTVRAPEIDEDTYDVNDNLADFGPIDEDSLLYFKKQRSLFENSDDVICGSLGGTAFGDVALVPGPMFKEPKGIRDYTDWYISIATRPEILHEIFDWELENGIKNLQKIHDVLGETIQVAYVCGTDFGTQNSPFCSVETFRNLYKPYYQAVNEWIHEHTSWKTFKHSCGSIRPLIPELIDCGFDILNPVQWTADNMDREALKRDFGKDITFWGGGIDTQNLFPNGTYQEVFDQALECLKIFSKGGGYVFNTIHNIVPGVPAENVKALCDAVNKFNKG